MRKNERGDTIKMLRAISTFTQIGFMITACIVVGVFAGRYLDRLLGTSPWLLIILSLLGVAAAFKSIFDYVKKSG